MPYSTFTTNGADIALAILNGILLLIISSTGAGFFSSRIRNIDVKLTFFDLIKFFNFSRDLMSFEHGVSSAELLKPYTPGFSF